VYHHVRWHIWWTGVLIWSMMGGNKILGATFMGWLLLPSPAWAKVRILMGIG
jgi:hypothetical protein